MKEKRKLSWLALRSAREDYWQLFSAAKGNPEKMMWMLERNKEVMKKWDEDSFAVTGWVEGDTTVLFSEDRPKGSCLSDNNASEQVGSKSGSAPRHQDNSSGPLPTAQYTVTIREKQSSITTMDTDKSSLDSNFADTLVPFPEVTPDEAAMQDDSQMSKG
jgi:hypothetical protein